MKALNVDEELTAAVPLRVSTHIALIREPTMTSLLLAVFEKLNFAKAKFRELLHSREIRENFVPRKFPAIRYFNYNVCTHIYVH